MTTSEIIRAVIALVLIAIVIARRFGLKKKLEERKAKVAEEKRIQRHKEQKREQREQQKQRHEAKRRETTEIRLQTLVGTVNGVANVGGQKLHYAVGGDREKAAAVLVLLHGFAGDKEIWQALALHLLKWPIHLVIPDLPGFGQNDPVLEAAYDASSQAKRIKALVHGLGIEKYHLVGHSVGAIIAATLAYGDRQCVSSLTLAEPFGYRVPHQSALDQMLANQRNPFMISTPEAYENLLGFLHAQPVSVDPRLKKLRAEEMAKRRQLKEYSKGMTRRIGLAQALINDPELIMLDEPTTGLDPIGTREMKDLIINLREQGKTVLMCSHLLADVQDVCDRIAILHQGELKELGRVDSLLKVQDETQIRATGLSKDAEDEIRSVIQKHGGNLVAMENPTSTLEDLFLSIVRDSEARPGRRVTQDQPKQNGDQG